MRARLNALFLLTAVSLPSPATAEVTRCDDANGNALYTDSTCPAGMRTIGPTSLPQSCTSADCERRRERDLREAHERVRAEMEQLAAYRTERHKREVEDRWIDEARYEAELRSAEAGTASSDDVLYPAYPFAGNPGRCGMRCVALSQRRHVSLSGIGNADLGHLRMKSPGDHRDIRQARNLPRHLLRDKASSRRTVQSGRLASNE